MAGDSNEEELLRSEALRNAAASLTRQSLERELAVERERLRITLASIGDAVISTDAAGRVTFLNPAAEDLTGWTRAEAVGRPMPDVFRIVHAHTREPVENPALRALREAAVVGLANHTILIARDGTERAIDDSAAPMRDGSGPPVGSVLVFRDVTERRRADELRERLAAIIESSEDAIVSKTLDGVIRSWNAGAERLFGYAAAEAVGRSITLIIPPERLDEERMILDRMRRGERVEHYETVRVARDGRRLDISLTVSPLRDAEGRVVGASKVARDITEKKRTERALRESEDRYRQAAAANAKFRTLFEQGTQFAGILALDGTVVEANRLCLDFCGFSRDEVVGKPFWECGWWNRSAELMDTIRGACRQAATGRPFRAESRYFVADGGERLVDLVIAPVTDDSGTVLFLAPTGIDITDRKRAEDALRESEGWHRFLSDLAAATEPLADPAEVMATVARMLAEHLGADRCAYAEVEDEAVYVITGDHPRGVPSIVGRWSVASFGAEHHRTMLANEPYVVSDADTDARIGPDDRAAFRATTIRAVICVPLHKGGRFTAAMAVHQKAPRSWAPAEVELVRTVVGRCWEALERARVARNLRESEARYRAIVEATPDCVKLVAPDGTLLQMNPAGLAMVEGDESALGRSVYNVIAPEHADAFRSFNDRVCRGEKGTLEFDVVGLKGTRRHMETAAVPLPAPSGGFTHLAVTRDVTDRRRAEDALRRSEAQFRQMADALPQIVWTARADGFVDYYNERWYEFTGFPRGEYGDESWKAVLHPDDVRRCAETYYGCVRSGDRYQIEYRFRDRRTGGYRWFLGRAYPVRDEGGRIVRWFGTCTDIDDTKRAAETIRFLADASAALAELTDPESTLQKVAALAVPFFADWCAVDVREPDGALRRVAVNHADPARVALVRELHRRYPPAPSDAQGVMRVVRTGEPEWVAVITDAMLVGSARDAEHLRGARELGLKSYISVPLKSRTGVLGALTFATAESGRVYGADDLRAVEDLAHRAVIAVENANLLAALRESDRRKDEFIALLAHELRNPLAPIRNGLEVMRLAGGLPEPAAQARDRMDRQLSHMVRLVDDLLDVSRISRGKMELRRAPVRMADVLSLAVETARPLIDEAGHDLAVSVPPEPILLDADLTRLAQVFANLLTNSARYTPRGGTIWLTATGAGREAVVTVRDTGIGIPADMLGRVFDMFSQVD
ncbi:MAG: PAS domain S-box protein, partial [Planctomycetes bacterium]|nr:PAS domain S-box protein [Planctomycetota bacterium]